MDERHFPFKPYVPVFNGPHNNGEVPGQKAGSGGDYDPQQRLHESLVVYMDSDPSTDYCIGKNGIPIRKTRRTM